VMVAEGLADYLQLGLNDTIIMIGQGYHGTNAVDQYPVTAILRFSNPQQNDNTIYAPIELVRQFAAAPVLATSVVLSIDELKRLDKVKRDLRRKLGEEYEVMDWTEMQPELVQLIQSDNAGGIILLGILYLVIAFGIFGTVMMMSMERHREFGVMVAVGMKKTTLAFLVSLETCIIGLLGLACSLVAGIFMLIYMYHHPIPMTGNAALAMKEMGIEPLLPFSLDPAIFTSQMLAIVVIMVMCLLYPFWNILHIRPITALRH
jgi:ABC-type lipoprotein release transport system permease subunit